MGLGGKRPGAGRKPVHDEMMAREICQSAIIKKFGSLQAGIEFLLDSEEATLMKFAYEHAYGKPRERQDVNLEMPPIQIQWPDGD
jgi:hypothetical protein